MVHQQWPPTTFSVEWTESQIPEDWWLKYHGRRSAEDEENQWYPVKPIPWTGGDKEISLKACTFLLQSSVLQGIEYRLFWTLILD